MTKLYGVYLNDDGCETRLYFGVHPDLYWPMRRLGLWDSDTLDLVAAQIAEENDLPEYDPEEGTFFAEGYDWNEELEGCEDRGWYKYFVLKADAEGYYERDIFSN